MNGPPPRRALRDPDALAQLAPRVCRDRLRSLSWEPGQVWLTVEKTRPDPACVQVLIEPRDEARPRYRHTPWLNVSYVGDELDPGGERLLRGCLQALGGLSFEALVEAVEVAAGEGDGGGRADGVGGDEGADRDTPPDDARPPDPAQESMRSIAALWGREALWDQFLAERVRKGSDVQLEGPAAIVMHGEYECGFVHGEVPCVRHLPFVESPWSALPYPARRRRRHRDAPAAAPAGGLTAYFTDLSEADAVLGRGRERLATLLAALAADERPALCHFNATCVPTLLGDDVAGLVARYRRDGGAPLYHVTERRGDALAGVAGIVRARVESGLAAGRTAPGVAPGTAPPPVALLGYAADEGDGGRGDHTLARLLARFGVDVGLSLFPAVRLDDAERLGRHAVRVARPDEHLSGLIDTIVADLPGVTIRPDAPYGIGRTRAWLRAVREALDRADGFDADWDRVWAPRAEGWDALTARAAGHTLLFPLRLPQLMRLADAPRHHAVPALAMIEELGFRVAVRLPRAGADADALVERAAAVCADALRAPPAELGVIEDAAELADLLRHGGYAAAYSELPFDRRLADAGVARFSAASLRMGIDGAERSLRRLLRSCELPFRGRYQGYLGGRGGRR